VLDSHTVADERDARARCVYVPLALPSSGGVSSGATRTGTCDGVTGSVCPFRQRGGPTPRYGASSRPSDTMTTACAYARSRQWSARARFTEAQIGRAGPPLGGLKNGCGAHGVRASFRLPSERRRRYIVDISVPRCVPCGAAGCCGLAGGGHGSGALAGMVQGHPAIIRGGGDHHIDGAGGGGVASVAEVDVAAVVPHGPIGHGSGRVWVAGQGAVAHGAERGGHVLRW